ncbi:hypothetical protein [Motilimonas sp. E26]|uniref:hypothetical protein n=1 Tax=Motilimonas sp. E26 TaxID=2865674 RepID=UPI001E4F95C4|nr:hypothetical protein [Motilimonas sp. E26]MCE0557463.1 hypothetical protein [Motilimonas sp. E26]
MITKLIPIENVFPEIMVGAPTPMVFADEHIVKLAYYDIEDDVALITFDHCFEFRMGMPGEDAISKSQYSGLGLLNFEPHVVEGSPWIDELEKRYKVISEFSRAQRNYVHYLFAFHERTFECIASGYEVTKLSAITVEKALINKVCNNLQ